MGLILAKVSAPPFPYKLVGNIALAVGKAWIPCGSPRGCLYWLGLCSVGKKLIAMILVKMMMVYIESLSQARLVIGILCNVSLTLATRSVHLPLYRWKYWRRRWQLASSTGAGGRALKPVLPTAHSILCYGRY